MANCESRISELELRIAQLERLIRENKHGDYSDVDIRNAMESGDLEVRAPLGLKIQPASIDIHLAPTVMYYSRRHGRDAVIDMSKPVDAFCEYEVIGEEGIIMHPGEFMLGVTREWFKLSNKLDANVDGKSSVGRLGFAVHITAGFIDPGFEGHVTLEMKNLLEHPIRIFGDKPIGQMRFKDLKTPSSICYGDPRLGSKQYKNEYDDNPRPIPSQYWKNFEQKEDLRTIARNIAIPFPGEE